MSMDIFRALHPATPGILVPGVDVSGWQTPTQVQEQTWADWVYLKVTQRSNFYEPTSVNQRIVVEWAGKPWGPYHFAEPDESSAVTQAQWFCQNVRRMGGPGPLDPMLDLEWGSGDLSAFVLDFASEVNRLLGRALVLYTGPSFARSHLRQRHDELVRIPLWLAHYTDPGEDPDVPPPWKDWACWQYTQESALGSLDLDVCRPGFLRPLVGGLAPDDDPRRIG